MNLSILVDSTLFSYSQIFFSNRRWFGALVILATFISPINGSIILFSVLITNLIALILSYDKKKVRDGFYGFNGLLFGAALSFFYKPNEYFIPILIIFLLINFFINTSVENYFAFAFNLPGLSLPFIISFYIFVFFNRSLGLFEPNITSFQVATSLDFLPAYFNLFLQEIGFLILQNSVFAGLLILLTILFFSRIMFFLSIIGFILSILIINLFSISPFSLMGILISLNAILVSIALGGSLIIPSNRSLILSFIGILISSVFTIVLQTIFQKFNLSVFVLPFNLTVFLVIYALKFRENTGEIVLLYFRPGSPEENYYYHKNQKSRFEKYKYINASLPFNGEWDVYQAIDGEYTHKKDWRFAFDFVIRDEYGKTYDEPGLKPEDYHCYGLPVVAPYKGKVVKVVDGIDENEIGKINIKQNWGNTVVIDHGLGLYSAISHLKKNSIKVKEGDSVEKGDIIGSCGNSGRSPEPHIHFQFQKNDKIGAPTLQFPFGHFLVRRSDSFELKSYDYPKHDEKIQKLDINAKVKDAFDFEFGDKYHIQYKRDGKTISEYWEVKIDPYNIPYIESSSGSIATFFNDEEVFYFTSYIGKKKDALYHFYLAALQIPFSTIKNLKWSDTYPLSMLVNTPIMILSDALILISNPFNAIGYFTVDECANGNFKYRNKIEFFGKGIFSFIKWNREYFVKIDKEGFLSSFCCTENDKIKCEFNFIMEEI